MTGGKKKKKKGVKRLDCASGCCEIRTHKRQCDRLILNQFKRSTHTATLAMVKQRSPVVYK